MCLLGLAALPSGAAAEDATLQGGGMDLHLFRPAVDTRGYFSVNGSEVMPHKEFSFGLVLDAGFGILRYNGFINDPSKAAADASEQNRIARQAFTGTFMFNFGLVDRLVVGISLPITFFRGHAVQAPDRGGSCLAGSTTCLYNLEAGGLRSQGVGDLTLHVKARLLNLGEFPAGIAVTLRAGFPTAKEREFAGEPGFSLWPTLVFEFQPIEKIRLALEGGYRWNSQQGATFIWDGSSIPSSNPASNPMDLAIAPEDQGSGRRFTYDDLITFGFGAAFRVAQPPDIVLELSGSDGCPDLDDDGDGILDVDDTCPLVAEDYDGDRDEDGCPEGREGDRDGDGIPDDIDQCPDEPEDFDGFQDDDGCPDPDNDGDGIPDQKDLCPNDPEDFDKFQDEDGCPDPDNDADRILDVDDACPNDPETYNGHEDEDGCPDKGLVILEDTQITILEKVYFETDSAIIKARSFPLLDAVAATLNASPQITLVEIQGHADERGSDDYNIKLTRARAASVMNALIERGVLKQRLRSGGYGERCPVDPRHNADAWEKNRRVEFKIIETDAGPTGVERVRESSPKAFAKHLAHSPEMLAPLSDELDAIPEYLGDRVSVLEKAVEKFPTLNHQGHQATACVEDPEAATWLYDAVHEALISEIDFDDEDVVRELKQVDSILAPLASRIGR